MTDVFTVTIRCDHGAKSPRVAYATELDVGSGWSIDSPRDGGDGPRDERHVRALDHRGNASETQNRWTDDTPRHVIVCSGCRSRTVIRDDRLAPVLDRLRQAGIATVKLDHLRRMI